MRRANSGAVLRPSSQPARCLTVTGTAPGSAARTARTRRSASSGSSISAAPAPRQISAPPLPLPPQTTFFAGQPMLRSTSAAPHSTASVAARTIGASSRPKICTPKGRPPREAVRRRRVLAAPAASACAERNSVMVRPAPSSSQMVRNDKSVISAMGASMTGGTMLSGPSCMVTAWRAPPDTRR